MRKFIIGVVTLLMIIGMVGCGNKMEIPQVEPTIMEESFTEILMETIEATELTIPTEPVEPTEPTEPAEKLRWEIPEANYTIDISRDAETDLERMAWAIYLEGGSDAVCDDCRRRMADVILNRVECRITNLDYYWADTIIGVLSDGGINPYQNMGNKCAWPKTAHEDYERHSVERAFRIAYEVMTGNHSEIYRKGYFYYAGANVYGWEPETAINCCGIWYMRQRGWDNSKFEQDWVLSFD